MTSFFRSCSSHSGWQRRAAAACTPLALGLCLLLANCGSERPIHYYMLESTPAPIPQTAKYPVTIVVGHVTAPILYRDDRLIYGSGSVELGADYYNRWAEAPAEMIENILVQDLRASGQFRTVERQASSARGDYILRGHLSALNEVDTAQGVAARFTIEFELYQPKTGSVVYTFQPYSHDEPANGKTPSAVVEAMQTNVRAALQQVTGELGQYFASHPAQ
jgi:ABC-type uncharacterized transport system auxiliary subunit